MAKTIYSEDHLYIVKQLKNARIESKLEQADVAKKIGKTQSHVSKIESGQRKIDITTLREFAKIYKKDLNFFLK